MKCLLSDISYTKRHTNNKKRQHNRRIRISMCSRGQNKLERHQFSHEEDSKPCISCYFDDIVLTGGRDILCVAYTPRPGWQYHHYHKYVSDCEPGSRLGENIHRVQ